MISKYPTWLPVYLAIVGAGFLLWDFARPIVWRFVIGDSLLVVFSVCAGCLFARWNRT